MANTIQLVSSIANTLTKGVKPPVTSKKVINVKDVISSLNRGTSSQTSRIGDTVQLSLKKFLAPTDKEVKELLS